MNRTTELYHAIKVDTQKCMGCVHCMRSCPTEAIRIVDGKAKIYDDRCVDCSICIRVCPTKAIYVEQDDISKIFEFKYRIAIFPSVLIGQFPKKISAPEIYAHLKKIGFTHSYEVEQPIGQLHNAITNFLNNTTIPKPHISSFCPAVVRLIQVKYPDLINQIVRCKTPQDLAAFHARKQLTIHGIDPKEIGIFYITPCPAKIAAITNPIGQKKSWINGTINMYEIYNRVMKAEAEHDLNPLPYYRDDLSEEGIQWSLPGGESRTFSRSSISIDGMDEVIKFLEKLENEEIKSIDYLDLKACKEGCAGGICMSENPFLTSNRTRGRGKKYPSFYSLPSKSYDDDEEPDLTITNVNSRPMVHLDKDFIKALEKLGRARRIMCHLPGIDCGACGAPTCSAHAEDIVCHKARMSDCIFLEQKWQSESKITPQRAFNRLEKKWGKGRFDFDCTKKGAANETS